MRRSLALILTISAFGLAACGDTDLERGASGAAIGGLGAAAVDGDVGVGAVAGGAAGVLCDDVGAC